MASLGRMLPLNELIYSQNSYHQIKPILLAKLPWRGSLICSVFFLGGGGVSVVKNRIATGFRIGRIVVIEVIKF